MKKIILKTATAFAVMVGLSACDDLDNLGGDIPELEPKLAKITTLEVGSVTDSMAYTGGNISDIGSVTLSNIGVIYFVEGTIDGSVFDSISISPGDLYLGTVGGDVRVPKEVFQEHLFLGTVGSDVRVEIEHLIEKGGGDFNVDLSGLEPNTKYRARAFATNCAGTTYGDEVSFETLP